MTLGPDFERERFMKYARALGVADDPVSLARWKCTIEQVMMVADAEVVATLSEHATAHNHHLELTRRHVQQLEDRGRQAVLDHNCSFFAGEEAEHRESQDVPPASLTE